MTQQPEYSNVLSLTLLNIHSNKRTEAHTDPSCIHAQLHKEQEQCIYICVSGFSRYLSGSSLGSKVGWRGCFTLISLSLFTGVPCYKKILEASQWPDKSAGASLSICLRGMSAGKHPATENLLSRRANLTDEIPCWRTGVDESPRALSMSLYVYPAEVSRSSEGHSFCRTRQLTSTAEMGDNDKMQVSTRDMTQMLCQPVSLHMTRSVNRNCSVWCRSSLCGAVSHIARSRWRNGRVGEQTMFV